jgi:hypothetical protein
MRLGGQLRERIATWRFEERKTVTVAVISLSFIGNEFQNTVVGVTAPPAAVTLSVAAIQFDPIRVGKFR